MAEEYVDIPMTLTVQDIRTGKINTDDLKKSMDAHMSNIAKSAGDILGNVDTTKFNKALSKSAENVVNAYDKVKSTSTNLQIAIESAGSSSKDYVNAVVKIKEEIEATTKSWQEQCDIIKESADLQSAMQKAKTGEAMSPAEADVFSTYMTSLQKYKDTIAQLKASMPNNQDFISTDSVVGVNNIVKSMNNYINAINNARHASDDFNISAEKNIYTDAYEKKIQELQKLEKEINAVRAESETLFEEDASDSAFEKINATVNDLQGKLNYCINDMKRMVQAGNAFSIDGDADAELERLKQSAKTLTERLQLAGVVFKDSKLPEILSKVKSALVGVISKLGDYIKSMGKASKSSNGFNLNLGKMFKSVMMYGLGFRSLYFLIKKLRSALIDSFGEMAKQVPDVNVQLSALKTAMNQLKGSIATAFQPIISVAVPALLNLLSAVNACLEGLGRFFATLSGQGFIYKFTAAQVDYAKSLDKTASSAKNANKQLGKFDELNNLTSNSGSGSGSSTDDALGTYEKVDVDKLFDGNDLTNLGAMIGTKLKDALSNIDWSGIKEKARDLAHMLATFINGFIEVENLGVRIGETLGQAINTAFEFLNEFVHTLHWDSLGKFIADTLNGIFYALDWNLITDTIITGLTGVAEAVVAFVENFNWDNISTAITNIVNAVSVGLYNAFLTIQTNLTDYIVGIDIADQINKTFEGINWEVIGATLASGFNIAFHTLLGFVTTLDFAKIGSSLATGLNRTIKDIDTASLCKSLSDIVSGLLTMISTFLSEFDWAELGIKIADIIVNIDWLGIIMKIGTVLVQAGVAVIEICSGLIGEILYTAVSSLIDYISEETEEHGGNIIAGLFFGIIDALKNIAGWLKDNVFTPIIKNFKSLFGIASPSKVMAEQGNFIMEGLYNGISKLVDKVTTPFRLIKDTIVTIFKTLWNVLKGIINSIISGVEALANGVVRAINKVIEVLNGLSFDIPEWVPEWGGKSFGLNIPTLNTISIPRLAQGAVIPPNKQFLAMLGDQSSGTNVEAPLSTIQDAVRAELDRHNGGYNVQLLEEMVNLMTQLVGKEFVISSDQVFNSVRVSANQYRRATGREAFL